MAEAKEPKKQTIAQILKDVMKDDDLRIGSLKSVLENVEARTTGNIGIDHIIGVGGLPKGRSVECYGAPSSGKSLPVGEPVLTPDGWRTIGTLRVGDLVLAPDGFLSAVVGVYEQGIRDTYRLTFSDGSFARSSLDHLWKVRRRASRRHGFEWKVRPLSSVLSDYETGVGRFEVFLPSPGALDFFHSSEIPLDPYLLGLLLGDGDLSGGLPRFGSADPELIEAVSLRLPEGVGMVPHSVSGESWWFSLTCGQRGGLENPLTRELRSLGVMGCVSAEKFVPSSYLRSTVKERRALLQGLLDTDGNWAPGGAEFSSASVQLRDDVVWLARSLGFVVSVSQKMGWYRLPDGTRRDCQVAYRASLRGPSSEMFALPRKALRGDRLRSPEKRLLSVVLEGAEEHVCIKVSSPSGLFITRDFTVTHNTTTAIQCAAAAQKAGEIILYEDFEQSVDKRYVQALGLDVEADSFLFGQPDSFESGMNAARRLIATGEIGVVIFDSVAAMTPAAVLGNETGKATIGLQARLMSESLKQLNSLLAKTGTTAIFLNHVFDILEMGGPGARPGAPKRTSTPGGRALKFYASVRLEYQQVKGHSGKQRDALTGEMVDVMIAQDVRVRVVKNKVAPPFRQCLVRVRFGRGFSNEFTALSVLIAYKAIVKSGGYFYFEKSPELVHPDMDVQKSGNHRPYILGEENVLKFADSHPEWSLILINKAQAAIDSLGDTFAVSEDEIEADPEEDLSPDAEELAELLIQEDLEPVSTTKTPSLVPPGEELVSVEDLLS